MLVELQHLCGYVQPSTSRHGVARVVGEVGQRGLKLCGVGQNRRHQLACVQRHRYVLAERAFQQPAGPFASSFTSIRRGCSGCRRAKASSRRMRSAQRSAPSRASSHSSLAMRSALSSAQADRDADDHGEAIIKIVCHPTCQITMASIFCACRAAAR